MNLSRCKVRTLIDVYYLYKYKKNIPRVSGTIPVPFIKASECTDHPCSVDWYEWKEIITLYIEKLKTHLEEGNSIELGSKLGEFHLTKFKCDRFIDFKKSKEQGRMVTFKKNNVDNYFIATSWARRKIHLKLKGYWKVKLNDAWLRRVYLACEKDYTKIYKIRDSK
jgi:hypothetical protein